MTGGNLDLSALDHVLFVLSRFWSSFLTLAPFCFLCVLVLFVVLRVELPTRAWPLMYKHIAGHSGIVCVADSYVVFAGVGGAVSFR